MYCINCGNKVDDDAYVCLNCGVVLKKRINKSRKIRNKTNLFEVIGLIFGIISFVLSFLLFFNDISNVGMYTKVYERIIYGIGYTGHVLFFTIVSLIFALINRKNKLNRVGLVLTLISFFLILSEIFVIVIY